jgi:tetratricopeptide (TPR) repeat protein
MADLDQAIRLVPNNAGAYSVRGVVRQSLGDGRGAVADLDQAIRLDPRSAQAFNNRCFVYSEQKDYDRAIADCDQAIKLSPNLAVAFSNRCAVRLAKVNNDAALSDCEQAIQLDPNYIGAYVNQGLVFEHSGDRARHREFPDSPCETAEVFDGQNVSGYGARTFGGFGRSIFSNEGTIEGGWWHVYRAGSDKRRYYLAFCHRQRRF